MNLSYEKSKTKILITEISKINSVIRKKYKL